MRYTIALMIALAMLTACTADEGNETGDDGRNQAYGSWKSPISAERVYADANSVGLIRAADDGIRWVEYRADNDGRHSVMRPGEKTGQVITADAVNVGTRVHEYGGGAMAAAGDTIYYTADGDQRLYRKAGAREPQALTPSSDGNLRYADCVPDPSRDRLICVREDHRDSGEASNTLMGVSLDREGEPDAGTVLFGGADFVGAPTVSPDGRRMAWRAWDHPNMPWDTMYVYLAEIAEDGSLQSIRRVAPDRGGSQTQPRFAPDGTLYFVADWSNWWNLYRLEQGEPAPVKAMSAEFAAPDWGFGNRNYAFLDADTAVVSYTQDGRWHLGWLALDDGTLTPLGEAFADIDQVVRAGDAVYFIGATATEGEAIYRSRGEGSPEPVYTPPGPELDPRYVSVPEAITFPTDGDQQAHGFFYPPKNPDYGGPGDASPPLIVMVHGGPTSAATAKLDPALQYWTSRGFGVLDVNYRGSTGYGREYRQSLYGNWGKYDVADAVNGAGWLAEQGRVDGDRLAIRGGSAGGFTTLAALAFRDRFDAGTSYYGVSDLELLTRETHKFESHYLDQIVGPYPETKDRYEARSPIHAIDGINAPLLLFQGLKDKVVPANQAETIYQGLRERGVPTAYVAFEEEAHGFEKPANRIRALSLELGFYGHVFGFDPAGDIPVPELK